MVGFGIHFGGLLDLLMDCYVGGRFVEHGEKKRKMVVDCGKSMF